MLKFRALRADEVYVRAQSVKQNGCILLLYKDSRCDMNILDETETVGPMNWKRSHSRDNANCTVSIWDENKKIWIDKEDTGVESYTEKEKGLAADSFKRACFNWGIGRELYTAPFIWVNLGPGEVMSKGKGYSLSYKVKFHVSEMTVKDGQIVSLTIEDNKGNIRYNMDGGKTVTPKAKKEKTISKTKEHDIQSLIEEVGADESKFIQFFKIGSLSDLPDSKYSKAVELLEKKRG